MTTSLRDLVEAVGGVLVGDGEIAIVGAATLETAEAGHITLLDRADRAPRLARSRAAAVVVPLDFTPENNLPAIQVADVHDAFAKIVRAFRPARQSPRAGTHLGATVAASAMVHPSATILPGAYIGEGATIAAGVVVHSGARVSAGCRVAENAVLHCNVVLYEGTIVGPRVIIHAGAVLGANGFGYKLRDGRHVLSAQLGYVEIEADVEIGANTTIDRGTYGPTVVGEGTKIDNLVMIAHNCRIGKHNMICSQVGIAGSTTTGDYVTMAGQVGVRDHVHIGSKAVLGAMSGVANDVPEGAHMLGAPAIPERDQKLQFATLSKLPEMRKQLKELERKVAALLEAGNSLPLHENRAA
ncbi:MAG: UDP-3-O-(3-hydroxymyristoyl)glucosamine N-acyltransferase [Pirellulales bacterium]